jgi:hypothetical protein
MIAIFLIFCILVKIAAIFEGAKLQKSNKIVDVK